MSSKAFPFTLKEQLFFVAIVMVYVLFDLAVLPVEQFVFDTRSFLTLEGCVEACVIGCYLAQVGILGCWSAMFAGSLVLRLLIANLLLVAVYFLIHQIMENSFLGILKMRQRWYQPTGWATLVIYLNATQIPLLVMRRATGYSLVLHGKPITQCRVRQFSVSEILGLMTFVSIPLFIMSVFLVPAADAPFLAAITISTGVISWLSLWMFLRPQLSVIGIVFLLLLGPGIIWLVFGLCLGIWSGRHAQAPRVPVYWIYVLAYLGVITQAALAVVLARAVGYRLRKANAEQVS